MSPNLHPRLQELERQFFAAPLQPIYAPEFNHHKVELWIKRDDLLHPIISGNKWRKLKYILNQALFLQTDTLISMGGAYSNHLHALAFAGKALGVKTIGLVRGEAPRQLNPTLQDLQAWGMELRFISRSDYQQLRNYKSHDSLPGLQAGQYWLPEGGAIELALQGIAESIAEITCDYASLVTACGTGATLAGLIAHAPASVQILGVAALKGADFLAQDVQQLLNTQGVNRNNWDITQDYHFGGFAKSKPVLPAFIQTFQNQHGIPLEPVYTGKTLFAVFDLLERGYFKPGQRIIVLHTGGLQGNRSLSLQL